MTALFHSLWLVPLGLVIAAIGTLVGSGGGVLLVPVLLLAFPEMGAAGVTETSLIVAVANAFAGTVSYVRMGRVDMRSGVRFALATLPGAILGVWAVRRTSFTSFAVVFAVLLLAIAGIVVWRVTQARWRDSRAIPPPDWRGVSASSVIGFCSSFFGIGGGALHVPVMVAWLRYPVHVATATSQFVLFFNTLVGVGTHLVAAGPPPHPERALWLVAGALPGSVLGAHLSTRVGSRRIMLILAAAIGGLAIRLLLRVLW